MICILSEVAENIFLMNLCITFSSRKLDPLLPVQVNWLDLACPVMGNLSSDWKEWGILPLLEVALCKSLYSWHNGSERDGRSRFTADDMDWNMG